MKKKRVVRRELDDMTHLLVINAIDDRRDRDDVHTGFVQVVNLAWRE